MCEWTVFLQDFLVCGCERMWYVEDKRRVSAHNRYPSECVSKNVLCQLCATVCGKSAISSRLPAVPHIPSLSLIHLQSGASDLPVSQMYVPGSSSPVPTGGSSPSPHHGRDNTPLYPAFPQNWYNRQNPHPVQNGGKSPPGNSSAETRRTP